MRSTLTVCTAVCFMIAAIFGGQTGAYNLAGMLMIAAAILEVGGK